MSLYVIGDLHLSLSVSKSMDVFDGWHDYVNRIHDNWINTIKDDDMIVLAGDSSWGMNFNECEEDFRFIDELPGKKILLKGNHDYWWATKSKIEKFFSENKFNSMSILHNNHYAYGEYGICGTRGWIKENDEPADAKVLARELHGWKRQSFQQKKQGSLR